MVLKSFWIDLPREKLIWINKIATAPILMGQRPFDKNTKKITLYSLGPKLWSIGYF